MNVFKDSFLLEPDIIFLNHGSFGATPKPVFETYQNWQKQLERQPVKFLGREIAGYLKEARASLASYLNVSGDDLTFVPNATFGVNVVARSLALSEGDEVLTCDQEYGACNNTWNYVSKQKGFSYKKQPIPLPVESSEEILEAFWQGVTDRTKVIYLSHITSPTALILPIAEICARAQAAGIMTVIDGAHAPGQLDLDLTKIDADFYTGNCHKWLCSPKGAAFLYVRPDKQDLIEPLVISWGLSREAQHSAGSTLPRPLRLVGDARPGGLLDGACGDCFSGRARLGERSGTLSQFIEGGARGQRSPHRLTYHLPDGQRPLPPIGRRRPAGHRRHGRFQNDVV